jgi:hypothetical protein
VPQRLPCALALVVFAAFAATPALADPKSDVMAAMTQFAKATSFHVAVAGRGIAMDGDMALPSKMHVTAAQFELIKIDSRTWVRLGGKWQRLQLPGMDQMTAEINGAIATARDASNDMIVTDLGMQAPSAGGPALHAYRITNKTDKSPATVFLDGGRLVEVDNADGTSAQFSKFNAPVSIEPPT